MERVEIPRDERIKILRIWIRLAPNRLKKEPEKLAEYLDEKMKMSEWEITRKQPEQRVSPPAWSEGSDE